MKYLAIIIIIIFHQKNTCAQVEKYFFNIEINKEKVWKQTTGIEKIKIPIDMLESWCGGIKVVATAKYFINAVKLCINEK